VPEAVHASKCIGVWGEKVRPIGEYGEEEAICNAVAKEGSYTCPQGRKAFDEGEDSLGQREPVSEVVGGGEAGGETVPQLSDNAGWVEKVSLQFNGSR